MTPVLRFAPSPNGELHLGHALSALIGFDSARRLGGRFLVRIEDIDRVRCPSHLVERALDDLAWLGITWEQPVLRQSEHFADYRAAATRLEAMGLLYPCFATRAEIAAAVRRPTPDVVDPDGAPLYPGLWRPDVCSPERRQEAEHRRRAGDPCALRLDMARAITAVSRLTAGRPLTFTEIDPAGRPTRVLAHPERWGDAVIVRKDTPASYHLSVVVDDARQTITLVTRGCDLYAATDIHRLLQVLLGLPEPLYHHHRLLTDTAGRKLSKSARDISLRELRGQGWSAADVRRAIAPIDSVYGLPHPSF